MCYCKKPKDTKYQTLSIFIPKNYFDIIETKEEKDKKIYTVEINQTNKQGKYNSKTAPVVFEVNTPGYAPNKSITHYKSFKKYIDNGFIVYYTGCRGREHGAPTAVTDLKASISFIRKNILDNNIPGNEKRIFSYGMSGGGAQSSLIGASGDCSLYNCYLEEIEAILDVSNNVCGSMCWCPITNLDYADAAYDWNMGIGRENLNEKDKNISDKLCKVFVDYINKVNFVDENKNELKLEDIKDENGYIGQKGSYYDYLCHVVEKSFENFIEDTKFPYEFQPFLGFHIIKKDDNSKKIYNNIDEYLNDLNSDINWISYDKENKKCKVTNLTGLIKLKKPTKGIGAFDSYNNKISPEQELFGTDGKGEKNHFDKNLMEIIKDIDNDNYKIFEEDLKKLDNLGKDIDTRLNMYTPLYYLMPYYKGYKSSKVAKYWRINVGLIQSDTSLCTETNLYLACKNFPDVKNVEYTSVWNMYHCKAERNGSNENDDEASSSNFIEWVNRCLENEEN